MENALACMFAKINEELLAGEVRKEHEFWKLHVGIKALEVSVRGLAEHVDGVSRVQSCNYQSFRNELRGMQEKMAGMQETMACHLEDLQNIHAYVKVCPKQNLKRQQRHLAVVKCINKTKPEVPTLPEIQQQLLPFPILVNNS